MNCSEKSLLHRNFIKTKTYNLQYKTFIEATLFLRPL